MTLANFVRLVVPSTFAVSCPDPDKAAWAVQATVDLFCRLFGGATTTAGQGYYVAHNGGVVAEDVTLVESFCNSQALQAGMPEVKRHVRAVARFMQQECVALVVNGKMLLIEAAGEEGSQGATNASQKGEAA